MMLTMMLLALAVAEPEPKMSENYDAPTLAAWIVDECTPDGSCPIKLTYIAKERTPEPGAKPAGHVWTESATVSKAALDALMAAVCIRDDSLRLRGFQQTVPACVAAPAPTPKPVAKKPAPPAKK